MSEFKCSSNCGCEVRIGHLETCTEKLKKEIGDVKKLMTKNLYTGIFIAIGVAANFLYLLLSSPPG